MENLNNGFRNNFYLFSFSMLSAFNLSFNAQAYGYLINAPFPNGTSKDGLICLTKPKQVYGSDSTWRLVFSKEDHRLIFNVTVDQSNLTISFSLYPTKGFYVYSYSQIIPLPYCSCKQCSDLQEMVEFDGIIVQ